MSVLRGARVLVLVPLALTAVLAAAGCAHRSEGYTTAGSGGGGLLGLGRKAPPARTAAPTQAGIGVNGYLWRATLDTLGFMPLASADPYGGVIITDWYVNPEKPDERFKATVYILDVRLRADGLNVNVFHQVRDGAGQWIDTTTSGQTDTDIENAILTKARQLRLSNLNGRG